MIWLPLLLACADESDPFSGRWVGSVTSLSLGEYVDDSYCPIWEPEFVGSTLALQLTSTAEGTRVAKVQQGASPADMVSGVYLGESDPTELRGEVGDVSLELSGDGLTGEATAVGFYSFEFNATRVAELPPQDPNALDGQWLVQGNWAESDCNSVSDSAEGTYDLGIGELTSAGERAVWRDPFWGQSLAGALEGSRFEGDYVWRWVTEMGEEGSSQIHAELDFEASAGLQWGRETGVRCYGLNVALARLTHRLERP